MREQELAEALKACQEYAELGYDFANDRYQEIHKTLKKARKQLKETNRRQSEIDRIANSLVVARAQENVEELQRMDREIQDDLNELLERQKEFSVVVFGRTMAGKSTLMEILTHGDGSSRGKGGQRTTRDVRDYHWKGMKVTDVPGICSFDGREDDELAMQAAKTADLVLFLITDDAPQDSEAEKLAELKRLGKNVLGIINVKLGLNMNRRKMALHDLEKKMNDTARIDEICDQFRAFGPRYHQDWSKLPFVATHLEAAYLGNREQGDPELYALSNFDAVEEYILDKVQNDACFLRVKTFIDNVSRPLSEQVAQLLDDASDTARAALRYRYKWNDLEEWRKQFLDESIEMHHNFIQRLREEIDDAIIEFAEENYDNEDAGEDWNELVASMEIKRRCQAWLKERSEVCNRKRRELADEFATEVRFQGVKMNVGALETGDTTDFGALFGGAAAVGVITGIGLPIVVGLGILSWLSDSKEKKIREAKEKMRNDLHKRMDPAIDGIEKQMIDIFNDEILRNGVDGFDQTLGDMDKMFFQLADAQVSFVDELMAELRFSNAMLWYMARGAVDGTDTKITDYIENVRLVGQSYTLFTPQKMPVETLRHIEALLGEEVQVYVLNPRDENASGKQRRRFAKKMVGEDWTAGSGISSFEYYGRDEEDLEFQFISLSDAVEEHPNMERSLQQMFSLPILRDDDY